MIDHQEIIDTAAEIARKAHAGQSDKAGKDYFSGHLTSVANLGKSWQEKVLGFLYDVAEDTPMTETEVMEELNRLISKPLEKSQYEELFDALVLLNNKHSGSREEYLSKIMENKLAASVKLNDLTNNLNLTRISNPTEKDFQRVERYKCEIEMVRKRLE